MTHSFGTPIYATAEEEQQARDSGELYGERYEQEMNYAVQNGGDAHDDNYFEKKAERYGQKMARKFLKKK